MPEGPETAITADVLNPHLSGFWIESIDIADNYLDKIKPGASNLLSLLPLQVTRVFAWGKRVFFDCFSGQTRVRLISFLSMEGSWKLSEGSHTCMKLTISSSIGLTESGGPILLEERTIFYNDTWRWGTITVCPDDESFSKALKGTGPDLLFDKISLEQYRAKITNSKLKEKQICWFLMEPKFFSGIGNYLKAEVLYRCRIAPSRTLGNLSETDVVNLYTESKSTIRESYAAGGLTTRSYWSPDGKRGNFPAQVYNRNTDNFGNPISQDELTDNRKSWWCPALQK